MSGKEKTEKNKRSNPDTMEIPNRLEKSVKLADGLGGLQSPNFGKINPLSHFVA